MAVDTRQLDAFLAVAEELHFGRAAARLHLTQPALSRTIRQLESDLGDRLFDRTTRSVRLTSAGEALVEPARELVESAVRARRALRAVGAGEAGRVRLGFAGPSSHILVSSLSQAVRTRHPGIELTLRSTTYASEGLRMVADRALDLAIVRWLAEPPGIAHRIVAEEHYVLVVAENHPFAGRDLVSLAECRDEPFVALADPGSSLREALVRTAQDAGFVPRVRQTANDSWTVMALVAAGVGITLTVDTAAIQVPRQGLAVVPLREGTAPTYSRLVWRREADNPALATVLRVSKEVLPSPGFA
ncbi:LysR substrate-binding domain-containing protein [Streptomyces sp. LHD-70]|uniref:LysR substrate-binding domain-containing protein n=1 Tax=Streptomyces sp. LHD-70 TaxID=3072140 RepID=UPI0028102544|nr:LysR substrate-binding domain-containing protein [Streptomyces sp. LHD-70]MDQ8701112.1 LysR substrate-binding domain-containing protein [Streptomyces sp. LHD-70]